MGYFFSASSHSYFGFFSSVFSVRGGGGGRGDKRHKVGCSALLMVYCPPYAGVWEGGRVKGRGEAGSGGKGWEGEESGGGVGEGGGGKLVSEPPSPSPSHPTSPFPPSPSPSLPFSTTLSAKEKIKKCVPFSSYSSVVLFFAFIAFLLCVGIGFCCFAVLLVGWLVLLLFFSLRECCFAFCAPLGIFF